jgi:ribosomal protein S18 acetylase RimI-like enzyme
MLQLALRTDRAAVNELARQIHALHVSWRPDIYAPVEEPFPEERFGACVAKRELYVAKVGGQVAGYVRLVVKDEDRPGPVHRRLMLLEEICVHELCRGQGIGTQMMQDVNALARAFGCAALRLGVYPQNDAAVGFYQKCGFAIRSISMDKNL